MCDGFGASMVLMKRTTEKRHCRNDQSPGHQDDDQRERRTTQRQVSTSSAISCSDLHFPRASNCLHYEYSIVHHPRTDIYISDSHRISSLILNALPASGVGTDRQDYWHDGRTFVPSRQRARLPKPAKACDDAAREIYSVHRDTGCSLSIPLPPTSGYTPLMYSLAFHRERIGRPSQRIKSATYSTSTDQNGKLTHRFSTGSHGSVNKNFGIPPRHRTIVTRCSPATRLGAVSQVTFP